MKSTDTDKTKAIRLQPAERLRLATQIMTGLLASGHYTQVTPPPPGAEDQPDEPQVRRFDWGKSWKEDGASQRFTAHVVSDARALLRELEAGFADEMVQREPNPVPVRLTPKKRRS